MEPSPIAQVAQLLPLILTVALTLWMSVRILRRAGYSGWWSLLTVVPLDSASRFPERWAMLAPSPDR